MVGSKHNRQQKIEQLSQKAIFAYFQQCDPLKGFIVGKGMEKIDPVLVRREKLVENGKVYFDYPLSTEFLSYLPKEKYRLTIPDSLSDKYTTETGQDYEHDYAIIHQFSPLMRTKTPEVFLMEHAVWNNTCGEESCYRTLVRKYIEFKIIDGVIVCQNELQLRDKADIIGFGGFKKKKMEEALPGEKIKRFGGGGGRNK